VRPDGKMPPANVRHDPFVCSSHAEPVAQCRCGSANEAHVAGRFARERPEGQEWHRAPYPPRPPPAVVHTPYEEDGPTQHNDIAHAVLTFELGGDGDEQRSLVMVSGQCFEPR